MRAQLSRFLNRFAVALAVVAVAAVAYLAFPSSPVSGQRRQTRGRRRRRSWVDDAASGQPDDASRRRVRQMEAELVALQAEAAKNPNRPTVAQMEAELNRLVAERHGEPDVARLERRVTELAGLALVLALALSGLSPWRT